MEPLGTLHKPRGQTLHDPCKHWLSCVMPGVGRAIACRGATGTPVFRRLYT